MDESDNYALKGGPETLSEEDQEQVYVRYRCYQSEEDLTSPDQSFSTMPDLTYEILKRFSLPTTRSIETHERLYESLFPRGILLKK